MSTPRRIDVPYPIKDARSGAYVDGWLDGWKAGASEERERQTERYRENTRFYGRWWSLGGVAVALVSGVLAATGWLMTGLAWVVLGVGFLALSEMSADA